MDKIQVIKKDGELERFDPNKIEKVLKATGLEPSQAKKVADYLNNWVLENCDNFKIQSQKIREKVIEELAKINTYAANLYTWYEKTKDGNK